MKITRCLTVCEPYAWCITAGHKSIENRTWATPYRGLIAIHSSTSDRHFNLESQDYLLDLNCKAITDALNDPRQADPQTPLDDLLFQKGKIVGVAELVDIVPLSAVSQSAAAGKLADSVWADGPLCWVLRNAVRFDRKIECKGALNLWNMPPAIADAVNAEYLRCRAKQVKAAAKLAATPAAGKQPAAVAG